MDILYKDDDFVFSYRVGGILIHNGKVLLQRPKDDDYAIIGGHVARMETSEETLRREYEEELHAKDIETVYFADRTIVASDRSAAFTEIYGDNNVKYQLAG